MRIKPIFSRPAAIATRTVAPALALLAIVLAVSTIGCTPAAETETKKSPADEPRAKERATDEEKPSAALPSDADSHRIARLFADAVFAGNYRAAYDLTSSRLQGRMSLEKFTAACKQAVQQFGEAVQLGKVVTDRTGGLAGSAASKQYGFPAEIPDGDRLAWAHFALALDVDGDEVLRCYDCWMLLENDRGKARIGHFAFLPCE
jgi:ABC-type Fe3+-hydroxamate transport system substrate-binding protein